MPTYKVEINRQVSRIVELRQTVDIYVDAPSVALAREAAWKLIEQDELPDFVEWRDDDASRLASNDEVASQSTRPEYVWPAGKIPVSSTVQSAKEILNLD